MPTIPEYPTMTISFRFLAAGSLALAASVHASQACSGDVDGDQRINVNDLLEVIGSWGACPPPPAECPADIDGTGDVGVDEVESVVEDPTVLIIDVREEDRDYGYGHIHGSWHYPHKTFMARDVMKELLTEELRLVLWSGVSPVRGGGRGGVGGLHQRELRRVGGRGWLTAGCW